MHLSLLDNSSNSKSKTDLRGTHLYPTFYYASLNTSSSAVCSTSSFQLITRKSFGQLSLLIKLIIHLKQIHQIKGD